MTHRALTAVTPHETSFPAKQSKVDTQCTTVMAQGYLQTHTCTHTHTNTHRVKRVELFNGQRISVQPFPFSHTGVGQFPAIKQLPILPAASPLTGCCSSQGVVPQLVCILCQAGLGCSLLCCNELVCASLCCTVRYNTRFRI